MEDLEQKLTQRIKSKVEQAVAQKSLTPEDFKELKDEITRNETRRFYLNYFAAVSKSHGKVNISAAARYGAYDQNNLVRKVRTDGFEIHELMEESEEISELEIPEEILDKGITYFQKEILIPSIMAPYLSLLLEKNEGNISAATREYGMDRNNFRRLLKKYGLSLTETIGK